MGEFTYYQRNKDVILNREKDYYENDKDRLRKEARDKSRNLLKKIKMKIWNTEKTDTMAIYLKKRNKG